MSDSFISSGAAQRWADLRVRLSEISKRHPDAVFASSLAAEDMLLAHAIFEAALPIHVFTLDTGRLHPETLGMVDRIAERYGVRVQVLHPDAKAVLAHVEAHGAFGFYDSIELRKACCGVRKAEPLRRALVGRSAWVTGQHRDQSVTRSQLPLSEFDTVFGLQKYNPLADWTHGQIWAGIHHFAIPYNPLHDQGYPSIGCEPCTRAVRPGEDVRAGRWWWEQSASRECGLHAGNLQGGEGNESQDDHREMAVWTWPRSVVPQHSE